jgi:hypothetical protein
MWAWTSDKAGDRVLVHGGGGCRCHSSAGSYTGAARVVATCSDGKMDMVLQLGAEKGRFDVSAFSPYSAQLF